MWTNRKGFHRGKQRYKCKCCGCNYTGGRNGYPDHIKIKAIKYYSEENGFEESNDWWVLAMCLLLIWLSSLLLNLRICEKVDIIELD